MEVTQINYEGSHTWKRNAKRRIFECSQHDDCEFEEEHEIYAAARTN